MLGKREKQKINQNFSHEIVQQTQTRKKNRMKVLN